MVSHGLSLCPSVHLSHVCLFIFSFSDDNLSKYQWIFIKLGTCIYISAVKTAFDIQVGRPKMTWKQLIEWDCREWKLSAIDPHDRHT